MGKPPLETCRGLISQLLSRFPTPTFRLAALRLPLDPNSTNSLLFQKMFLLFLFAQPVYVGIRPLDSSVDINFQPSDVLAGGTGLYVCHFFGMPRSLNLR